MASLKPFHGHLENLQCKAKNLTATGLALTNLFDEEASRLSRWDEASRLKALYHAVVAELDRVKRSELSASRGRSQANLILSLGTLAVGGMIKMSSNNKQL